MGLAKETLSGNGVKLEYWRIVSLSIFVNQQCVIDYAGYTSKEKRDEESAALAEARETGEYPETNIYIESRFVTIDYDPEMSVAKAYEYLKSLEDFADAEDVIESWYAGVSYHTEDTVDYEGDTYHCVQSHESQAGWEPPSTPALWAKVGGQSSVSEWVQPTGAHDTYAKGARVLHGGKEWVSNTDNNSWEPGVYGWDEG